MNEALDLALGQWKKVAEMIGGTASGTYQSVVCSSLQMSAKTAIALNRSTTY